MVNWNKSLTNIIDHISENHVEAIQTCAAIDTDCLIRDNTHGKYRIAIRL
jgi:hypothetical protein